MVDLAMPAVDNSKPDVVPIMRRLADPNTLTEMTIRATTMRSIKTETKWTKMVAWLAGAPMMGRRRRTRSPMKTTNIAGKRNRKYSTSYSVRRASIYFQISEWLRRFHLTFLCVGRPLLWKMTKILWKLCTSLLLLSAVRTITRNSGQVSSRMRGFLEKYRVLPKTTSRALPPSTTWRTSTRTTSCPRCSLSPTNTSPESSPTITAPKVHLPQVSSAKT